MLKVNSIRKPSHDDHKRDTSTRKSVVLRHDERHLRRKAIELTDGSKILFDLAESVVLAAGDELLLEDGTIVEIQAAHEALYSVTTSDQLRLMELIWHIGNRHLPAEILLDRIVIASDHVIKNLLEGLGATVTEISAPFNPTRGAYAGHSHDQHHGHHHAH